ncbi:MAG: hypothetical protein WCK90_06285, partial [archaeon]
GLTDYFQRMSDYLFQTKTPLYLLERFEPNEKGTLDSLNALSKAAYSRAREAISRLDFDNFFPPAREEMRITIETADIRDQHIASNLERAEGYIRRTYPSLASKETISLNAFMGSSHMPELYTKMTIGVVDLTQNTSGLLRALLKNYRLTGELPDRDLLAYQIDNFITVGAIPHIFSYEELETLELEQLKTRIIEWGNTLPDAPEPSTVSA